MDASGHVLKCGCWGWTRCGGGSCQRRRISAGESGL